MGHTRGFPTIHTPCVHQVKTTSTQKLAAISSRHGKQRWFTVANCGCWINRWLNGTGQASQALHSEQGQCKVNVKLPQWQSARKGRFCNLLGWIWIGVAGHMTSQRKLEAARQLPKAKLLRQQSCCSVARWRASAKDTCRKFKRMLEQDTYIGKAFLS